MGSIGLDPRDYGTHSLRRTMPALVYRNTKDLPAIEELLGHSKRESAQRCLALIGDKSSRHTAGRKARSQRRRPR